MLDTRLSGLTHSHILHSNPFSTSMSSSQPPFKDMAPSWPPGKKVLYWKRQKIIEFILHARINLNVFLEKFCQDLKLYEFLSNIISGLDWRPPITASAGVPFPTQPPLRPLAFLASPPPLPATISSNNNQQLMELIGALRERSSPTPTEGNAILFWITHQTKKVVGALSKRYFDEN